MGDKKIKYVCLFVCVVVFFFFGFRLVMTKTEGKRAAVGVRAGL